MSERERERERRGGGGETEGAGWKERVSHSKASHPCLDWSN